MSAGVLMQNEISIRNTSVRIVVYTRPIFIYLSTCSVIWCYMIRRSPPFSLDYGTGNQVNTVATAPSHRHVNGGRP